MLNRYVLRLVSIACLAPLSLPATLIFVSRDESGNVLLSADSLIGHENGEISYGCKISQSQKMFWAISGVMRESDTGYDLEQSIRNLLGDEVTIPEPKFEAIKTDLLNSVGMAAASLKKNHPAFYSENMEGRYVSFIIVSRLDRHVHSCDSKIKSGIASMWDCVELPDTKGRNGKFIAGDNGPAREYISKHADLPALNLIQKVFPLSADKLPKSIGGKTSILSVPRRGSASWIEVGECPEVVAYNAKQQKKRQP